MECFIPVVTLVTRVKTFTDFDIISEYYVHSITGEIVVKSSGSSFGSEPNGVHRGDSGEMHTERLTLNQNLQLLVPNLYHDW